MVRGKPFPKGQDPWNLKGRETRECRGCGGEFEITLGQLTGSYKGLYCSTACANGAQRRYDVDEVIALIESGEKVRDIAPRFGVSPTSISHALRLRGYKRKTKGTNYRRRTLNGAEKRCVVCGYDRIPEILLVHHVDGNRKNDSDENLAVLCPNCHAAAHYMAKGPRYKVVPISLSDLARLVAGT